jgi:hypothetical protein
VDGRGDLTALGIFQLAKARQFGFIIIRVRPSVRLVLIGRRLQIRFYAEGHISVC